jgi:hypothetical protein
MYVCVYTYIFLGMELNYGHLLSSIYIYIYKEMFIATKIPHNFLNLVSIISRIVEYLLRNIIRPKRLQ